MDCKVKIIHYEHRSGATHKLKAVVSRAVLTTNYHLEFTMITVQHGMLQDLLCSFLLVGSVS